MQRVVCKSYRSPAARVALGHLRAASAIRSKPQTRERLSRAYRFTLTRAQPLPPSDKAWRPEDDFALLRALCFAARPLSNRNGLRPVRFRTFRVFYLPERRVALRNPSRASAGVWNSAPDEQANGCFEGEKRTSRGQALNPPGALLNARLVGQAGRYPIPRHPCRQAQKPK
jgi:hypothetical protein